MSINIVITIRYLIWEATWIQIRICPLRNTASAEMVSVKRGAMMPYLRPTDRFTTRIRHRNTALEICWQNESQEVKVRLANLSRECRHSAILYLQYWTCEGNGCRGIAETVELFIAAGFREKYYYIPKTTLKPRTAKIWGACKYTSNGLEEVVVIVPNLLSWHIVDNYPHVLALTMWSTKSFE